MRGWVYIITNKSMPGLIKVGYTMKDPELRAAELNHTGAPHPYNVDYDVLIENPREIENRVHCYLKNQKEGKEWFRCTTKEAIAAIKAVAGTDVILENVKHVDSAKSALFQQPKTTLERDIPGKIVDRAAYNRRMVSLQQEFKIHHKFSSKAFKAYAKKNITKLDPIPDDIKKWLESDDFKKWLG